MKTCRLPLGQYSVRITGCGESRHAPMKLQMFWWLKSLHWYKDKVRRYSGSWLFPLLSIYSTTNMNTVNKFRSLTIKWKSPKHWRCGSVESMRFPFNRGTTFSEWHVLKMEAHLWRLGPVWGGYLVMSGLVWLYYLEILSGFLMATQQLSKTVNSVKMLKPRDTVLKITDLESQIYITLNPLI